MKRFFTLLSKERRLLARDRKGILSILLFTALVVLLLFFGLSHFEIEREGLLPNIVWLATLFGGTLQLNRCFDYEREGAVMEGLKMIPNIAGSIFFSKFFINTVVILFIAFFATILASVLLNYSGDFLFLIPITLGAIGMSAVGTTFSTMFIGHHKKEILLPTLFYPLITPLVIAVIKASDSSTLETLAWLKMIVAFNVICLRHLGALLSTILRRKR